MMRTGDAKQDFKATQLSNLQILTVNKHSLHIPSKFTAKLFIPNSYNMEYAMSWQVSLKLFP